MSSQPVDRFCPPGHNDPDEVPVALIPVVVLSGRFQPFHQGHHDAYRWLVARWGAGAVRLGTSDRTGAGDRQNRPAPLSFAEKRRVITELFDVPPEAVVCVRSPYRPVEVLAGLDPETHAYIAAVGEKDAARLESRPYFRPLPDDGTSEPFPLRGYVQVVPASLFPHSGSEIRAAFGDSDRSYAEKRALFRGWYGREHDELLGLMISRFSVAG